MANRIPRPGGELPTYMVGKPKRATAIKQSFQWSPDQTPRVKDGTIYPRNPMPGSVNPRKRPVGPTR